MTIEVLKSKIHRVTVTGAELDYVGSITIDPVEDNLEIENGLKKLLEPLQKWIYPKLYCLDQ